MRFCSVSYVGKLLTFDIWKFWQAFMGKRENLSSLLCPRGYVSHLAAEGRTLSPIKSDSVHKTPSLVIGRVKICKYPHQVRSHGGLCGAKPQKIKIGPQNFINDDVFRSVQIGMLVLRADFSESSVEGPSDPPAKARAFGGSRWPAASATISAPPKSP